jgi:hypothetical protein
MPRLFGDGDGPKCAHPRCFWRLDPHLVEAGYKTHGGACGPEPETVRQLRAVPDPPAPDGARAAELAVKFAEIARLDALHKARTARVIAAEMWPDRFPAAEPEAGL